MASLDYGMNGYNVVNANGETSPLPICVLYGGPSASLPLTAYFSERGPDPYALAVENGAVGTGCSAIRTNVSGLWEISYNIAFTGAGAGAGEIQLYVDKNITFDGSGNWNPGVAGNSYVIGNQRVLTATGVTSSSTNTITVFLEKDCYVSLYLRNGGGTLPTQAAIDGVYFSLRCVSTDNNKKLAVQT